MQRGPVTPVSRSLRVIFGCLVVAASVICMTIAAAGMARFAVANGILQPTAYAVSFVLEIAVVVLPAVIKALRSRHSVLLRVLLFVSWFLLAIFGCLATHATLSLYLATIEHRGAAEAERRAAVNDELARIEAVRQRLSSPQIPQPSRFIREALAAEIVPPAVWRNSTECRQIADRSYFQKVCAKIVELRRELAAAEDFERLSAEARDLRRRLSDLPIAAPTDPLTDAFTATIGRFISIEGRAGIALILTVSLQLISWVGWPVLMSLRDDQTDPGPVSSQLQTTADNPPTSGTNAQSTRLNLPPSVPVPETTEGRSQSDVSPERSSLIGSDVKVQGGRKRPHNPRHSRESILAHLGRDDQSEHVGRYIDERLRPSQSARLAASDVLDDYRVWCAKQRIEPLSQRKLGAELSRRDNKRQKSGGHIFYCDVQLVPCPHLPNAINAKHIAHQATV
jgi:hypothetical protein